MSGKINQKVRKSFPTIEEISLKVLIEAYKSVLSNNLYNLDWKEKQFSVHLLSFMKKSNLKTTYHLTMDSERELIEYDELPIDDNDPDKVPRIDIRILSWKFAKDKEVEYFFEAKNLSQRNWNKKSGTLVSASYYYGRYIDTGIENFRTNRYYDGSLLGYILQGKIVPIVENLNKQLNQDTNTINQIENIKYIKGFSHCYKSKHLTPSKKELNIKHVFLKF